MSCEYCGDTGICGYDAAPQYCGMCPAGPREIEKRRAASPPSLWELLESGSVSAATDADGPHIRIDFDDYEVREGVLAFLTRERDPR